MKNVIKKLRSIILAVFFVLVISNSVLAEPEVLVEKKGLFEYSSVASVKARNKVSSSQVEVSSLEELRNEIHKNLKNYVNEITIIYNEYTPSIFEHIAKAINDLIEEDEYFSGTYSRLNWGINWSLGKTIIVINAEYLTNKAQEDFVDAEVNRIVSELIDPDMTDFQKVKLINDWIVNNTVYSNVAETSPHAAYTLFYEGKGVCQAYALAAYRLLENAGLNVHYVTGKAGRTPDSAEGHAWNLVQVDGKWYHLDTTWNDPVSYDGSNILRYEYFLISDEAIESDHLKDDRIVYPAATDTRYEIMREIIDPIELENSLYYINWDDGYKIYKLDLDTMKKTKLSENNVRFLVGYGEWLYYSNYSHYGYLYKVKTDGTEDIQLNSVYSKDLYIEIPYLYYYDSFNFKKDRIEIIKIVAAEGISLDRTEDISLTVGGQPVSIKATITPHDANDKRVIWASSNENVAIAANGKITPIKAGVTTISATTVDGGFTASVKVTVKDGYKIFKLNDSKTDSKYTWSIKLNKQLNPDTVNSSSVYIENEYGERLDEKDFVVSLSDNDPTIITIANRGEYERNKVYYVVVDKYLMSTEGNELIEAVKMPFIIK